MASPSHSMITCLPPITTVQTTASSHNPYEEITRLKKAAKIAVRLATEIAYRETTVSQATVNDDTINLVAKMLGQNAPSERTIELVHETLGTNLTKN